MGAVLRTQSVWRNIRGNGGRTQGKERKESTTSGWVARSHVCSMSETIIDSYQHPSQAGERRDCVEQLPLWSLAESPCRHRLDAVVIQTRLMAQATVASGQGATDGGVDFLSTLPKDVMLGIFQFLDSTALVALSMTSKVCLEWHQASWGLRKRESLLMSFPVTVQL